MKIAVCISGHLRNFEMTYNSFHQTILDKYDCDIFIHTWDTLGYSSAYKMDTTLYQTSSKIKQIQNLYNPKNIIIESSIFVEDLKKDANLYAPHLKNCPKHPGHMASMFYKIYACNELRKKHELETGIKYDAIIRTRSDLIYHNELKISDLPKNKIFLPSCVSKHGWYTDQFAFGKSDEMDLYSSIYFDIPDYFKQKGEFYPEKFVYWSLSKKQLQNEWSDIKITILR